MNSPLENRKVRLRGLGGQSVCGVRGTCVSATEDYRISFSIGIIRPSHGGRLVPVRGETIWAIRIPLKKYFLGRDADSVNDLRDAQKQAVRTT